MGVSPVRRLGALALAAGLACGGSAPAPRSFTVPYRPSSGTRAMNARRRPSGDQRKPLTPSFASVILTGSPPVASITCSWAGFSPSVRRKAMREPSGLNRGELSLNPRVILLGAAEPSIGTAHS